MHLYLCFLFFHVDFSYHVGVTCFQPKEIPLVFLVRKSLLAINSLFCSLGNVLISPSLWKIALPDLGLGWQVYNLCTLSILSHRFLASIVSDKKSTVNLIEVSLINDESFCCWKQPFPAFKHFPFSFLSASLLWCDCGFICVYPV